MNKLIRQIKRELNRIKNIQDVEEKEILLALEVVQNIFKALSGTTENKIKVYVNAMCWAGTCLLWRLGDPDPQKFAEVGHELDELVSARLQDSPPQPTVSIDRVINCIKV